MSDNDPIFGKGELITNSYFSGRAWLEMLVSDTETYNCTIGNVTFEPGVRNNWHTHPGGQVLLCMDGKGYYQEKGKAVQLLAKGDVVQIAPDIMHWHGAAPDSQFTHLAVTPNTPEGGVQWLHPVSDDEYNNVG